MNIWKESSWLNKIAKRLEAVYLYMTHSIFMSFKIHVIYNSKLIFEEIFHRSQKCGVHFFLRSTIFVLVLCWFLGGFYEGHKMKKKTLKIALPCTSLKGHIITAHLNRFQSRKNTLIKMHKIRICRLKIFLLVKAQIHYKVNLLVGFHKLHTFRWHLVRVRSHCSYIHYWVNVINYLRNHCF